MSKISYEKCICFIFLVILVILSCSGFPIDNLAMSVNSKKNFRTSSSYSRSDDFLNKLFNLRSTQNIETFPSHKLRHQRQLRAQTRDFRNTRLPMGHIEALVIPNDDDSLPTSELFVPSTDTFHSLPPTKTINTRSERSSSNLRHRTKPQNCFDEHFTTKAYKADIVLHVKAQSYSKRKNHATYKVFFKVIKQLKNSLENSLPIHDRIHFQFSNSTRICEKEERRGRKNLVKADVRVSQEYILFLNASGDLLSAPERISKQKQKKEFMMKMLEKVCSPKFKLIPPHITKLENKSSTTSRKGKKRNRLKLVCRVQGLPLPRITWRRDNVTITNSANVRINYVKRRSTLVIRKPMETDFGRYECVARGVDGTTAFSSIRVNRPTKRPSTTTERPSTTTSFGTTCNETLTQFCLNDGDCHVDLNGVLFCVCKNGFQGERCQEKTSYDAASMYPQTSLYTCKLGLSTKYYC